METLFRLEGDEVERVEFSLRFISNRQERPFYIKGGIKYHEPYSAWQRADMYWIECTLGGTDLGAFSVQPSLTNPEDYYLTRNWNRVQGDDLSRLMERATAWFRTTGAYPKQVEWTQNLVAKIKQDKEYGFTEPMPDAEYQEYLAIQ